MSGGIEQYSGFGFNGLTPRESRRVTRQAGSIRAGGELRERHVDAETDVTMNKIENVTLATGAAMQGVVKVATAQQALEQMAPQASGRLAMIAEAHTLGLVDELAMLRHRIRRV